MVNVEGETDTDRTLMVRLSLKTLLKYVARPEQGVANFLIGGP